MKQLIVNADDFGYCESVNYGIIKAYKDGIVRSTTIMANMPGFNHAIELAKANSGLKIGIHLTMSCFKPLLTTHQTLVDEEGFFFKNNSTFDEEELYQEFVTQIEKVLATGISVTHFDSHHHVHTQQHLQPVIERIMKKYQIPFRGGFEYEQGYEPQSTLNGKFYAQHASIDGLKAILSTLEEGKVYDLMCHPAYLDQFVYELSSYNLKRMEELKILCSQEIKDFLIKHDIQLVTYDIFKQ